MKKRLLSLILLCCFLSACGLSPEVPPATQTETDTEFVTETTGAQLPVMPLPATIDMQNLDNCTIAVSLKEGDVYMDDTGAMQMRVTVYIYDLYDMADIARLEIGNTITIRQQDVRIDTLEWTGYGALLINGGLDMGGFELRCNDSGMFFESGYSDVKSWQSIGEVTIPVSPDFVYTDSSDLDRDPVVCYPGDFLTCGTGIDYAFTPHNTSIVIQNGFVTAMHRIYAP